MCAARLVTASVGLPRQKGRDRSGGHCVRRGERDAPLRPYGIGPIVRLVSARNRGSARSANAFSQNAQLLGRRAQKDAA